MPTAPGGHTQGWKSRKLSDPPHNCQFTGSTPTALLPKARSERFRAGSTLIDLPRLDFTDRSTTILLMSPVPDTRERILRSARELIYSRSYADVGVAAICERAGVKKGSFYHFYPSKRDLTIAVIDAYYWEMKAHMLDQAFSPKLPPLQRLERLAELIYEFQKMHAERTGHMLGCPFGNLAVELSTQDEAIRQKVADIFTKVRAGIRQALREALETGEMQDVDVDATAHAMLAYLEGVMLMAKTRNDPEVIRQLFPALAQIRIRAAKERPQDKRA